MVAGEPSLLVALVTLIDRLPMPATAPPPGRRPRPATPGPSWRPSRLMDRQWRGGPACTLALPLLLFPSSRRPTARDDGSLLTQSPPSLSPAARPLAAHRS